MIKRMYIMSLNMPMKKGGLVYNRKHFITKKLSYTEGALSAAFPQLFFIEITRLFFTT